MSTCLVQHKVVDASALGYLNECARLDINEFLGVQIVQLWCSVLSMHTSNFGLLAFNVFLEA